MQQHRRPPPDITPEHFFNRWLPEEIERLGSAAGIPEVVVRITLTGEGGGAWDLLTREGQLEVRPPEPRTTPLVSLGLSVQDWRALVVGEEGPVDLSPPSASPTDLLFVDEASRQLLAILSGTFRFEVREYNGRTWSLVATVGSAPPRDPPDAVIATDAATYGAILARSLSAPEAYFSGRITISGNAALGMQLGLALLPKM